MSNASQQNSSRKNRTRPRKNSDGSQKLQKKDSVLGENSKLHSETAAKQANKQGSLPEQSCYNKYGCPFNTRMAQKAASTLPQLGDKQASTVSNRKTKFFKVLIETTGENVVFCDLCYECFKANEKCDYCCQVYLNSADDGEVDGQLWMSCDKCEKWNHPDCEIKYGKDPEYRAAAEESKRQQDEEAAADLNAAGGENQQQTFGGDNNSGVLQADGA